MGRDGETLSWKSYLYSVPICGLERIRLETSLSQSVVLACCGRVFFPVLAVRTSFVLLYVREKGAGRPSRSTSQKLIQK